MSLSGIRLPELEPGDVMEQERHLTAKALQYQYRVMRAYVRYYLKYEPETLERMSIKQLAEAFNDVLFVRKRERKM